MNFRNIYIFGGSGNIGTYLAIEIQQRFACDKVIIVDKDCSSIHRNISLFPDSCFEVVETNLLDRNSAEIEFTFSTRDVIFFLAAEADMSRSFDKNVDVINYNSTLIDRVLTNKSSDAAILIFPSSLSVYQNFSGPVCEALDLRNSPPISPYSLSKLIDEGRILERRKDAVGKTFILRLATVYGKSIAINLRTAINKFCYHVARELPLEIWRSAVGQRRAYLSLRDLLNAIEIILSSIDADSGIYNVHSGQYSMENIIRIFQSVEKEISVDYIDGPPIPNKSQEVSISKISSLGFAPSGDIQADIHEIVDYLRNV
jgi:UDP-glucose 4-epimerase